jgi:hypothetical protein
MYVYRELRIGKQGLSLRRHDDSLMLNSVSWSLEGNAVGDVLM